ncbi:hypothetical protein EDD16DRAFT_1522901 [Pisolithus croceorrhizus]|nr:hypothetical protein EDD16DRAFT_1522901 [Pisolithus croceorrhizus]
MSQPLSLIPTPLATAVQDWLLLKPNMMRGSTGRRCEKIKRWQRRLQPRRGQRLSTGRERWWSCIGRRKLSTRREENECWEKEENEHWEREANKHQEWEAQAWAASQFEGRVSQSCDPEVDCTYELAKATGTKKVWKCIVLVESTSLRAGEKKKHAQAKSLEVEVVGGSLQAEKGKSVACDTLITGGLYTIATAIDWHTEEMAQLWQMVKMLGSLHHHMIESMVELLQETTYPEPELPAESGSEESEEAKALDKLGQK